LTRLDSNVAEVFDFTGLNGVFPAEVPWGPTGEAVYERTYSRPLADGSREHYPETVARVVWGNLSLVHGAEVSEWPTEAIEEAARLAHYMVTFGIIPAGRHLWASGVKGRQFLFNCHSAGFDSDPKTHVDFMLMRLAEGGGVGSNYSTRYLRRQGHPVSEVVAHIVCDPSHPDYQAMADAGILSDEYAPDWPGAFEVEDTREGWSASIGALMDAAWSPETKHRQRVFDVSRVRWSGARLKTTGGTASGPQPLAEALVKIADTLTRSVQRTADNRKWPSPGQTFSLSPIEAMEIDDAIAQAIVAGGTRRSARMSICHWNDPGIWDFLNCKADSSKHWTTNISVEIDAEFIHLLTTNDPKGYNTLNHFLKMQGHAHKVMDRITEGMLSNGEPGIWNSTLSNADEPNEVTTTNPCGEIALEDWENCNLGHVNLSSFVTPDGEIDWTGLAEAHQLVTRFLMRATYGDVIDGKQAAVLARNRRIGVGHLGVQGFLAKRSERLSEAARGVLPMTLHTLAQVVDRAATEYAHELRIPVPVKKRTVAPTGTTAKMPGATEGIHSIYARHFIRRVRYSSTDRNQAAQVEALRAKGHHVEPDKYAANTVVVEFLTEDNLVAEVKAMGIDPAVVESADQISLEAMLEMQATYQECWADNAVSFTVNVEAEQHQRQAIFENSPNVPAPTPKRHNEVKWTLIPFLSRLKGTTLMVDGSREQAPYERISETEFRNRVARGEDVAIDSSLDEDCATGACPIK
jgi:adenosylcobalamin-dependent ribonucleoside-triphosphate reductase